MRLPLLLASFLAVVAVAAATDAVAKPRPLPRTAVVLAVETPLGTQKGNIAVAFRLRDARRRLSDVEVQYGVDVDADGRITDGTEPAPVGAAPYPNEWFPATEDRTDSRDTRRDKDPRLFTTFGDIGAAHGYVWKSSADLAVDARLAARYALTSEGRRIPDPDNPGSYVLDGRAAAGGATIRMRPFVRVGRKETPVHGAWAYSQPFDLDNTRKPSMTIDSVAPAAGKPRTILVGWTIFHDDSEDLNGNGVLDIALSEDKNNDGLLEPIRCIAAFDWHLLAAGEDPSKMTRGELDALAWRPCIRDDSFGGVELDLRPGVAVPQVGPFAGYPAAPTGVGRRWAFAWDTDAQFGTASPTDAFILRATPADEFRHQGETFYSKIVVRPGQ